MSSIIKTSPKPRLELSQSEEEMTNEQVFDNILSQLRPDLYLLEVYRRELQVQNIDFLRKVLKSVFNIISGSGWGETIIQVRGGKITKIETSEGELIQEGERDLFDEGRR